MTNLESYGRCACEGCGVHAMGETQRRTVRPGYCSNCGRRAVRPLVLLDRTGPDRKLAGPG